MGINKPFSKFEDFRRKMSNKVFFEETTPGTFVRNKNFHIKTGFWTDEKYNEIDTFCYNIRDGIANLIDGQIKVFKQICANKNLTSSKKLSLTKMRYM